MFAIGTLLSAPPQTHAQDIFCLNFFGLVYTEAADAFQAAHIIQTVSPFMRPSHEIQDLYPFIAEMVEVLKASHPPFNTSLFYMTGLQSLRPTPDKEVFSLFKSCLS